MIKILVHREPPAIEISCPGREPYIIWNYSEAALFVDDLIEALQQWNRRIKR